MAAHGQAFKRKRQHLKAWCGLWWCLSLKNLFNSKMLIFHDFQRWNRYNVLLERSRMALDRTCQGFLVAIGWARKTLTLSFKNDNLLCRRRAGRQSNEHFRVWKRVIGVIPFARFLLYAKAWILHNGILEETNGSYKSKNKRFNRFCHQLFQQ
jgi:hypothetical protein